MFTDSVLFMRWLNCQSHVVLTFIAPATSFFITICCLLLSPSKHSCDLYGWPDNQQSHVVVDEAADFDWCRVRSRLFSTDLNGNRDTRRQPENYSILWLRLHEAYSRIMRQPPPCGGCAPNDAALNGLESSTCAKNITSHCKLHDYRDLLVHVVASNRQDGNTPVALMTWPLPRLTFPSDTVGEDHLEKPDKVQLMYPLWNMSKSMWLKNVEESFLLVVTWQTSLPSISHLALKYFILHLFPSSLSVLQALWYFNIYFTQDCYWDRTGPCMLMSWDEVLYYVKAVQSDDIQTLASEKLVCSPTLQW